MIVSFKNGSSIKILDSEETKRGFFRGRKLTDREYHEMMFLEQTQAEERVSKLIKEMGL